MQGLELAALHSKAVDYVKTGEPAQMPKRLRPGKWPHFMEKRYKPKDAQYHSNRILGQLYDKVETVNFKAQYEEPFDKRILRAYALDDNILKTARQIKSKYDREMRQVLAHNEVKTEFEIWSTFVLFKPLRTNIALSALSKLAAEISPFLGLLWPLCTRSPRRKWIFLLPSAAQ
jgi:RNA-dependent RNA polymerase